MTYPDNVTAVLLPSVDRVDNRDKHGLRGLQDGTGELPMCGAVAVLDAPSKAGRGWGSRLELKENAERLTP